MLWRHKGRHRNWARIHIGHGDMYRGFHSLPTVYTIGIFSIMYFIGLFWLLLMLWFNKLIILAVVFTKAIENYTIATTAKWLGIVASCIIIILFMHNIIIIILKKRLSTLIILNYIVFYYWLNFTADLINLLIRMILYKDQRFIYFLGFIYK